MILTQLARGGGLYLIFIAKFSWSQNILKKLNPCVSVYHALATSPLSFNNVLCNISDGRDTVSTEYN